METLTASAPRCQPALPGSACSPNGTLRQGLEVRHARVRQEQEDGQQRGETAKRLGQRDQKGSTEEEETGDTEEDEEKGTTEEGEEDHAEQEPRAQVKVG